MLSRQQIAHALSLAYEEETRDEQLDWDDAVTDEAVAYVNNAMRLTPIAESIPADGTLGFFRKLAIEDQQELPYDAFYREQDAWPAVGDIMTALVASEPERANWTRVSCVQDRRAYIGEDGSIWFTKEWSYGFMDEDKDRLILRVPCGQITPTGERHGDTSPICSAEDGLEYDLAELIDFDFLYPPE